MTPTRNQGNLIMTEYHPNDSRMKIDDSGTCQTLTSRMGTGGNNVPCVIEVRKPTGKTVALEGNGSRPSHRGDGYKESDVMYTLNTTEVHGVAYAFDRAAYNQGKNAQWDFTVEPEICPPLVARGPGGVFQPVSANLSHIKK